MICKEIGHGNLNVSARLREKDQLGGLSEAFSGMLAQLRSRRGEQYMRLETARNNLNALQGALSDPAMSRKLVESVDKILALLAEEMKER